MRLEFLRLWRRICNQLRLWLAAFAYMILERLRTQGCHGTELASATAGSIRLKLLKVAAQVTVSVFPPSIPGNSRKTDWAMKYPV